MAFVPSRVIELVETFDRNIDTYRSQQYNETQVRREFIDPLFQELGWDVTNKAGYAHAYKDVIHEDAIKVSGATKAPDYSFRIGGTRKFFLEAKKPSVNIKGDPHPAYQLRRYAWSAKLPLSILTDFEEFAVYDCLSRPKQTDRASTARIMYYTYKDYLDNWQEIADTFSKEAILKGSFDKFAASAKGKRGTTTVDTEFLAEIEKWRNMLARTIAMRNRSLSVGEINFAVQRTIDRILFLRLCEDRGIEQYAQLQGISSGDRTYPRLCELFERADQKYNSGLFHFEDEPGRATPPDKLTPNIKIDDKDLKWILHNLYYPQCPYEFSVLPAEILGNVYEQFLGKVITLTRAHQAKIEEKPEVKKAGGVYYTPSYIVDYIVKNTVGKLLNDPAASEPRLAPGPVPGAPPKPNQKPLTPKQINKIKILDPACGSGSFLLGAYTYLLNYHRDWYAANNPEKWTKKKNPPIYQVPAPRTENPIFSPAFHAGSSPNYRLTIAEKKRILLNNIFGVDIDSQAVEVTKLSLLLKVLEDENAQSLENQYRLFHERALPDLAENIKCGNSLIAPDFFDNNVIPSEVEESIKNTAAKRPQKRLAPGPVPGVSTESDPTQELYKKINPFDWKQEFPKIFKRKNPGFDAVIGNPPYVRIQGFSREQVQYFTRRYASAMKSADIYVSFVELGHSLLQSHGVLAFILPNKFFRTDYGEGLRAYLSSRAAVTHVVDFKASQVFSGTTYTCLLFLSAGTTHETFYATNPASATSLEEISFSRIRTSSLDKTPWFFRTPESDHLIRRIQHRNPILLDLPAEMSRGSSTGADSAFIVEADGQTIEPEILRIPLFATDFDRYQFSPSHPKRIIFPYYMEGPNYSLYPESVLRKRFPNAFKHLSDHRKTLVKRKQYKEWYAFSAPRNLLLHDSASIVVPLLANHGSFALLPATISGTLCPMASGGFTITLSPEARISVKYLLAILNSKLLYWVLQQSSNIFRGGWITCTKQYFGKLPIRTIDFDNPDDKAIHDKIVTLVDRMLALHKQLAAAKIPDEKTKIQRQITATDKIIDDLVYTLYNLTKEEIKIVEGEKG